MKFLSQVAATLVGVFMFSVLAFFGLLVVGAVIGNSSKGTELKANSVIDRSESFRGNFIGSSRSIG